MYSVLVSGYEVDFYFNRDGEAIIHQITNGFKTLTRKGFMKIANNLYHLGLFNNALEQEGYTI